MPASKSPGIYIEIDQKAMARAQAALAKYEGRYWQQRMEALFMTGARMLVAPMRSVAPVKKTPYPAKKKDRVPGTLRKSISARKDRVPPLGYFLKVGTKPRAAHGHLQSKTHRIVGHRPDKKLLGRSTPDPFIERTISSEEHKVIDFIKRNTVNEGISPFSVGIGGFS